MKKIVLIGAGSGFGARLTTDILATPELQDSVIGLCDIHEGRLSQITSYVQTMIDTYKLPAKLESSTDRTTLLPGADYVITSISAGGGAYYGHPYKAEVEIPRKYGIEQTVADTYSVGALFRLLRTGPVHLQICRDIEKYCPNALLLNHTNPMVGLTMLHSMATKVQNVGLCHGVQGTAGEIGHLIGYKESELAYKVAGVNHLAWFLELKDAKTGADLYPLIYDRLADTENEISKKFSRHEAVRIEIMKSFGYFPTESNSHDSEYMTYFRRTPDDLKRYHLSPKEPVADTLKDKRSWMVDGAGEQVAGELTSSNEYTISIIKATITNEPFVFNGNVMNNFLIDNLPHDLCVEVPCIANMHGINPTHIGNLPTHLAGFNIACGTPVQLAVESILERDKQKAFYAVAQDVNAMACTSLDNIKKMFDELWEAEGNLLEWYEKGYTTERCAVN